MYKKIILASAILAATVGVASANTAAPYVGAGLGITNNTVTINSNSYGSYRGVPFNLFVGYGGVVSQSFYLAGELTGTFATANISDNADLKTTYGAGLSVLPGVMVNDNTLVYGRLGVVRSHFNEDKDRDGATFGVGLQTSLTQNIDVRGEYNYVAYKAINVVTPVTTVSVAPRSDQFTLGLVYKIS